MRFIFLFPVYFIYYIILSLILWNYWNVLCVFCFCLFVCLFCSYIYYKAFTYILILTVLITSVVYRRHHVMVSQFGLSRAVNQHCTFMTNRPKEVLILKQSKIYLLATDMSRVFFLHILYVWLLAVLYHFMLFVSGLGCINY